MLLVSDPRIAGAAILSVLLVVFAISTAHADVSAEVALGDRAWAERSDVVDERGHAAPERVRVAISAYERALEAEPGRIDLHWKRVRALYFAGEFASADDAESAEYFERARRAAEEAGVALDGAIPGDRVINEQSPAELAAALPPALRGDVAALHLWSAIAWGAWTRYQGIVTIVRSGVPHKLKRQSEIVLLLDPSLENGGAHRLLAALHSSLPRVPFYTGWVDRAQAFVELDQAMAIAPTFPGNRLLYALTILELDPERRDEALSLLEQVAALEPDPNEKAEQLAMRAAARDRLEQEGRSLATR